MVNSIIVHLKYANEQTGYYSTQAAIESPVILVGFHRVGVSLG
jgi:hypothetical protein